MTTLSRERQALDHALTILRRHEPTADGRCTCERPWPCNIADRVAERAAELETTVGALHAALHQPTVAIPHLASRRSEAACP